jgi:hypothetical protein
MRASRYRMMGSICQDCGNIDFPIRKICSKCGCVKLKEQPLSGRGEIFSFTIIHAAPEGFEKITPYPVCLVKLVEGPVITAQLVGVPEKIMIGMPVKTVFRKIYEQGGSGLINYGFKFELVEK